jgi:hypothetical protein
MSNKDKSFIEESKEAILDNEHSIGEKAPGTPFGVVALSYLAVLAIVCGMVTMYLWVT